MGSKLRGCATSPVKKVKKMGKKSADPQSDEEALVLTQWVKKKPSNHQHVPSLFKAMGNLSPVIRISWRWIPLWWLDRPCWLCFQFHCSQHASHCGPCTIWYQWPNTKSHAQLQTRFQGQPPVHSCCQMILEEMGEVGIHLQNSCRSIPSHSPQAHLRGSCSTLALLRDNRLGEPTITLVLLQLVCLASWASSSCWWRLTSYSSSVRYSGGGTSVCVSL